MAKTATTSILRYEVKMGALVKRFYGGNRFIPGCMRKLYTDGLKNGGGLSANYGSVKSTTRNFASSGLLTCLKSQVFR